MYPRDAGLAYRLIYMLVWSLFRLFTRIHITGRENVPRTGPIIVSPNHLHSLDIPLVFLCVPRRVTVLVADKWRGMFGGWIMSRATDVIFVARGEADREAITASLQALKAGAALAVAPEGTRSHKPGLQEGHDGAAYLASRTGATIVPVAVWGHEKAVSTVFRFRRPEVHAVVCKPITLPSEAARARTVELHRYTQEIMLAIAREMPAEYRGVYADRVLQEAMAVADADAA
jgi:1-acyl-sn-glycerol-3-phosphate acyltransferase